jgi:hypothetical protein
MNGFGGMDFYGNPDTIGVEVVRKYDTQRL